MECWGFFGGILTTQKQQQRCGGGQEWKLSEGIEFLSKILGYTLQDGYRTV
jgi:hypothetical protein